MHENSDRSNYAGSEDRIRKLQEKFMFYEIGRQYAVDTVQPKDTKRKPRLALELSELYLRSYISSPKSRE